MYDLEFLVNRLRTVSDLKGLTFSVLKEIVYSGQLLYYPANTAVFREGDTAAGMYVLIDGRVRLTKTGIQGTESIIYTLKPVVMFNETTVIDNQPNPVTAVADQDSVAWQIFPHRYQVLIQKYPEIGLGLLRILAERNRVLLSRYEDLMSRPVLARTAKMLLALNQDGSKVINRYEHPNRRIAAMAATVPEAVSRSLCFAEKGIIECSRAQIKILSREELTRYAQVDPIIMRYPIAT